MASYHCSVKIISRSSGKSSVAAASYRSCSKLYDERQDSTFDYSKKQGLAHSEIIAPTNSPDWIVDREKLWNAVEKSETRKDSQLSREIEIALPTELNRDKQIELTRDFVNVNFVSKGMVADINIHDVGGNPHAHIMLTTREINENCFGKKDRSWNQKENILEWRKSWADIQNQHLAKNGFDIRVDHRSHEERGIDLEPQNKLGIAKNISENSPKGTDLDKIKEHQRITRENGEKIIKDPDIGLTSLSYHHGIFSQHDIDKLSHRCSSDAEQFYTVRSAINQSPNLLYLGNGEDNLDRFTTKQIIESEKQMLTDAQTMIGKYSHPVEDNFVDQAFDNKPTITDEQKAAVNHIVQSGDMCVMIGHAGSGKSYTLDVVRESYEAQGYTVKGVALSGIAAEGLQASSGIDSKTIHRQLWDWDQGRDALNQKSILVVDEAGMIGTRQMHQLIEHANQAGAKVVMVGDGEQLQPIETGGGFRTISDRAGGVKLQEVRRQEIEWQREATKLLSADSRVAGKAIDDYQTKGNIKSLKTLDECKDRLIQDWGAYQTREKETGLHKGSLILAYRNKDVADLNHRARELKKDLGHIEKQGQTYETVKGQREFSSGDRIMFLKNENSLGVKNGSIGTVETVDQHALSVRLDNNKLVACDVSQYKHFDHGYAATIHKSQGATINQTFILGTNHFDKHTALVALSRHKEDTQMYVSKDGDGFSNYKHFKETMTRERPKELVTEYAERRGIHIDDIQKERRAGSPEKNTELGKPTVTEKDKFIDRYEKNTGRKLSFVKENEYSKDKALTGIYGGSFVVDNKKYAMVITQDKGRVLVPSEDKFKAGQGLRYDGQNICPDLKAHEIEKNREKNNGMELGK
jgi:Ti-type conjugative transfer relaxase TraA